MKYLDKSPNIHKSVINLGGKIIGDCKIEKDCNIWFHATIRGDMDKITIKEGTTMVPVAFLSNILELEIEWDAEIKSITMIKDLYHKSHYQEATNEE